MDTEHIDFELARGGAWLTLNRPDALNAITPRMLMELDSALSAAAQSSACAAVVLRANGRAFCAGADLKVVRRELGSDDAAMMEFLRTISGLCDRIEAFPKPVIASVGGLTLAGGLELVLACDIVIASACAKFGDAHANYGLLPGGGGSARLPRKIGVGRAKYMMFTAEHMPAEDMRAAGLVNQLVDRENLAGETQRIVSLLASRSPIGLARMKRLIDDGMEQPKAVSVRYELAMNEIHNLSQDRAEGLKAFEEKRTPRFTGR
jgi:enoyl-CoA hydratase